MTATRDRIASEPRFSEMVRAATRPEHDAAENVGFVRALLDGQLRQEAYAELVAQLYFPYTVLEQGADAMRDDPVAGPFVFVELARIPALREDLAFLVGSDWAGRIEPNPATQRYCDRLSEVCFTWSAGFVAHHYVRYLGDLSGGQIIRRVIERAYDLTGGLGTQFFRFPGIAKPKTFKDCYRSLLDSASWDALERQRFVDEAKLAFRLNAELLDELGTGMDRHLVA